MQFPLHAAVVRPVEEPKVPTGHGVHTEVPARPKVPTEQEVLVPTGAVAPGPQAVPAGAKQGPVHRLELKPGVAPKRPWGHGWHGLLSPNPNWPAGHSVMLLVGPTAPGPHWLPGLAEQPVQPSHEARPVALLNVPAGHGVQTPGEK